MVSVDFGARHSASGRSSRTTWCPGRARSRLTSSEITTPGRYPSELGHCRRRPLWLARHRACGLAYLLAGFDPRKIFLLGEVEDVSVDAMGRLQLGPDTEIIYETTAPFLWTAAQRNGVLWVGSGNDGKVFTVDASGSGTEVFDAKELNIHAIAPTSAGSAYVGASPDGAVYEVGADATPPHTVFDPDERYIWALTIHPETGDIYVGTGEPGRIYRVQADGNATLHYDTEATHVLALSWDSDGNLLAGTASPGRLFRIDDEGQGFVLLDSGFDELRSLRLADDGTIYAVAVSQSAARSEKPSVTPAASSGGTPTVTTTVTAVAVGGGGSTSTASQSDTAAPAGGAVYRIRPDGVWDVFWESKTDAPYVVSLSGDDAGRQVVLVGTGPTGKIFQVMDNPPRVVLLTRAPAKQITSLVKTPDGGHYYVTANPGKVHRLSAVQAPSGSYVSDVRDAQMVATWGTVRWRATEPAGTAVRLFTRSGNTDKPNATWSPWSEPYQNPAGSLISSPKARYLQWKAELAGTDATPTLLSVTTAIFQPTCDRRSPSSLSTRRRRVSTAVLWDRPSDCRSGSGRGSSGLRPTAPMERRSQHRLDGGFIGRAFRVSSGLHVTITRTTSSLTCCIGSSQEPTGLS